MTIMGAKTAERLGLMRLIDRRFAGVAKGVGTGKILGRVHTVCACQRSRHDLATCPVVFCWRAQQPSSSAKPSCCVPLKC